MSLWQGVAEFVAVAERSNFTAAAKRLGISVAQVSRQVTALEQRLDIKLFYRTTRKVSLTAEGQVYLQHCQRLLEGLEEAERAVTRLREEPRGLIRLTAPVTYGEDIVMPLVIRFMQRFPEIEVSAELTNKPLDLVAEGFDLAIRIGELASSSLMATRLAQRQQYVCASPAYLQQAGTPHTLTDLAQHNCLMGNNPFWRFQVDCREQRLKVQGNLHCTSGKALRQAALAGLGVIQLPGQYVLEDIQNGQLISVLEHVQINSEPIWAIYPHNRHLSPKVRRLIDAIRDGLN